MEGTSQLPSAMATFDDEPLTQPYISDTLTSSLRKFHRNPTVAPPGALRLVLPSSVQPNRQKSLKSRCRNSTNTIIHLLIPYFYSLLLFYRVDFFHNYVMANGGVFCVAAWAVAQRLTPSAGARTTNGEGEAQDFQSSLTVCLSALRFLCPCPLAPSVTPL